MRKPVPLPKWLQHGLHRIERERKAALIARPMRNLFDGLARGDAFEANGKVIMRMPELDASFAKEADWAEVAPAIEGWIDCWARIAPDISTYHMRILAERLAADKPITPRLVEQAREEFDATVARIVDTPDGVISRAIVDCQIKWEFEKLQEAA
jgi:hypothetical protein